jgi:hypothetical protein
MSERYRAPSAVGMKSKQTDILQNIKTGIQYKKKSIGKSVKSNTKD